MYFNVCRENEYVLWEAFNNTCKLFKPGFCQFSTYFLPRLAMNPITNDYSRKNYPFNHLSFKGRNLKITNFSDKNENAFSLNRNSRDEKYDISRNIN